jgi:hypothetical protein
MQTREESLNKCQKKISDCEQQLRIEESENWARVQLFGCCLFMVAKKSQTTMIR